MYTERELTRIAERFHAVDSQSGYGDAQYALHELAHFVVLFRRAPRKEKDEFREMNDVLDAMTCGRAQLHELRTIKLQYAFLGKKFPAPELSQVWHGIEDAADDYRRGGRSIVSSKYKARKLLKSIKVSPRLLKAYKLAIARFM